MFEAYQVAVKLSLVNQVSNGLMVIAQGLRQTDREVRNTNTGLLEMENRLKALKRQALVGGTLVAAGGFGLAMLGAPMQAAREYELAFTKFKTLNLGETVNRQADHFARSANIMGVSGKELMDTLSESVGLFGSFDMAKRLAPMISQLNVANGAIFKGKIDSIDSGSARSLQKFIDRRGGTHDEAAFIRGVNLAQRLVTGSGGFIQFRDLEQFSSMGGTAFRALSDEGVLNMALLLQEQGGAKAGTSLMSGFQNLVAGRGTKAAMQIAENLGLGHIVQQNIGTVGGKGQTRSRLVLEKEFEALYSANPPEAYRRFILPAIEQKYGAGDQAALKVINDMLSNRTASNQGSIMGTQQLQLLRDNNLAKNAMDFAQTIATFQQTNTAKLIDLHKRYQDVLNELGTITLPVVVKALEGLNSGLRSISDFARAHPNITAGLIGMFGVMAAAATAGGAIMLVKAGFGTLATVLGGGAAATGGVGLVSALGATLGPLGLLVGGVVALGIAAGGLSWLAKLLGPDKKNDGGNHDGQHWVEGKGPRGAGGYWASNRRAIGPRQGYEVWDGENYVREGGGSASGYVPPRTSSPMRTINNTIVMPNGQVLAKVVTQEQAKSLNRPATGATGFDTSMAPAGLAVTGAN